MNSSFDAVKNWILNSGIQNITANARKNGSFNSWYDIDKKTYPFMYSEITGYGITALLYLYNITGKEIFLERANLAGNWLLNQAMHECGGIITRIYHDGKIDRMVYVFDSGMVLYGLVNLARISNNDRYLDGAKTVADFLLRMQMSNGRFNAMFDVETGPLNSDEKWSTQPGGYHAKISFGMIELSKILDKDRYEKSAKKVCDAALGFQDCSGRFVFGGKTHLHPHAYACEGLFYATKTLGKNYTESIEKAVRWALNQQSANGGLSTLCSESGVDENQRTDVLSQLVRLGVLMFQENMLLGCKEGVERLLRRLLSFQNLDGAQAGGFFYGYEHGQRLNHINSWCSMFALQAIGFHDEYFTKKNKVKIDYFV